MKTAKNLIFISATVLSSLIYLDSSAFADPTICKTLIADFNLCTSVLLKCANNKSGYIPDKTKVAAIILNVTEKENEKSYTLLGPTQGVISYVDKPERDSWVQQEVKKQGVGDKFTAQLIGVVVDANFPLQKDSDCQSGKNSSDNSQISNDSNDPEPAGDTKNDTNQD